MRITKYSRITCIEGKVTTFTDIMLEKVELQHPTAANQTHCLNDMLATAELQHPMTVQKLTALMISCLQEQNYNTQ